MFHTEINYFFTLNEIEMCFFFSLIVLEILKCSVKIYNKNQKPNFGKNLLEFNFTNVSHRETD